MTVEGQQRAASSDDPEGNLSNCARSVAKFVSAHADAHRIEAEIRYDRHSLRLRFRDDGKGIDPAILKNRWTTWDIGDWHGMRERAERIHAQLDFWSETGAGTEVQLMIPATVAYERPRERVAVLEFIRRWRNT